jgi:energy-converting hydrogenase Eha subunit A
MKNVLIGIFSIPAAILLGYGFLAWTSNTAFRYSYGGSISLFPGTIIILGLASLGVNLYAAKHSHVYKRSSVATLALVMPWVSAALSAVAILYGLSLASAIFK